MNTNTALNSFAHAYDRACKLFDEDNLAECIDQAQDLSL